MIGRARKRRFLPSPVSRNKLFVTIVDVGLDSSSLSGTERSAHFKVVIDLTSLGASVKGHVGTSAVSSLHLNVDVGQIVDAQGLTLGGVELVLSLRDGVSEALTIFFVTVSTGLVVQILEEHVVLVVGGELEWVLVVSEQGIVAVGEVSERASLIDKVRMLDMKVKFQRKALTRKKVFSIGAL